MTDRDTYMMDYLTSLECEDVQKRIRDSQWKAKVCKVIEIIMCVVLISFTVVSPLFFWYGVLFVNFWFLLISVICLILILPALRITRSLKDEMIDWIKRSDRLERELQKLTSKSAYPVAIGYEDFKERIRERIGE